MTKEEFLGLKRHSRVKYVGKDAKVAALIKANAPNAAQVKGLIVDYVYDYGKSHYPEDRKQELVLRTWNAGSYSNFVPEDWIIADDRRNDLVRGREKRKVVRADQYVRNELDNFTKQFSNMHVTKKMIDKFLEDIPLAERLRILTTLTDEQKAWLQLVTMDPAQVIAVLKKLATDDPEDVPAEVTDGSNGSDVPVSSETPVCPS